MTYPGLLVWLIPKPAIGEKSGGASRPANNRNLMGFLDAFKAVFEARERQMRRH
jgi:hypothetical protein